MRLQGGAEPLDVARTPLACTTLERKLDDLSWCMDYFESNANRFEISNNGTGTSKKGLFQSDGHECGCQ